MRVRRVKIHMNAGRKPVHEITDRAKRYRANSRENRPGPPKQCGFCGSHRRIEVHHINGRESDGAPDNLMWSCRRCNTAVGHVLRRARIGRLTRQYNPARPKGSKRSLMQAYGNAIKVMRGLFDGDCRGGSRYHPGDASRCSLRLHVAELAGAPAILRA